MATKNKEEKNSTKTTKSSSSKKSTTKKNVSSKKNTTNQKSKSTSSKNLNTKNNSSKKAQNYEHAKTTIQKKGTNKKSKSIEKDNQNKKSSKTNKNTKSTKQKNLNTKNIKNSNTIQLKSNNKTNTKLAKNISEKKQAIKFKFQKKHIPIVLIILFSILIIFSACKTIIWYIEKNKMNEQVEEINENNEVNEIEDNENTEIIGQNVDKSNPYWDYIKMNLINVDFAELKKTNKDTVGWIQVNGTNINYPFVQTTDNSYYLNHSFDKTKNSGGWVFLDYRNNIKTLNKNTILYAHGGQQQTMFGSLKNILKSGWLNNSNNYVVKLSTETENTLWQVFSVYRIPTTSDYIQVGFSTNKEFENFGKMLIDRSAHNFNTSIDKNDKILTLSTCYNDNDKVVLHAKLIKRSAR